MGSPRKEHIENLFADPRMAQHFEPPVFTPGVSSRSLRNRHEFLRVANEAGLLPKQEWEALLAAHKEGKFTTRHTERFFECLEGIPVTQGRKGSREDVKLHYSVELWRKAKTLNRGRSVIGCTFAHLIALKRFVEDGFDLILEDNVRAPPDHCAERIWHAIDASKEWELERQAKGGDNSDGIDRNQQDRNCHFRFAGWLGSVPNLEWILNLHSKKRGYVRTTELRGSAVDDNINQLGSFFPFPISEYLETDLPEMEKAMQHSDVSRTGDLEQSDEQGENEANAKQSRRKPGGNPIWGSYAYWMSAQAYQNLIETLRNDVGAMLWKGKRMRFYSVKPIDKILPRQTIAAFGHHSVHISTHPAFFRAPMLTSKIHTQWDPEFCKSTEYQIEQSGMDWSDLWLTKDEQDIISHRRATSEWLTLAKLSQLKLDDETM